MSYQTFRERMTISAHTPSSQHKVQLLEPAELEDEWGITRPALLVATKGQDLRLTVMEITPAMAQQWLETNLRNPRKLRPAVASRYASDMAVGKWAFPVDFIGFDAAGNVINGQHRLKACVECGISFVSLVIYGVPDEATEAIDRGLKRALADTLAGRGYAHGKDLQSALRLIWRWDRGAVLDNKVNPTGVQALAWLEENPGLVDAVPMVQPLAKRKLRTSVMAPLIYRAMQIDPDIAKEFVAQLISGEGLMADNPAMKLRDLNVTANKRRRPGDPQAYDLALAIKAWNFFVQGKPASFLRWAREGQNRESFPAMTDHYGEPVLFADAADTQFGDPGPEAEG